MNWRLSDSRSSRRLAFNVVLSTRQRTCSTNFHCIFCRPADLVQPQAKRMLHSTWDAPTKKVANYMFDLFINTLEAKHSSAVECLREDRDVLAFYKFPAENRCHIRTTNPIESTFATIRLHHRKSKNESAKASLVMLFRLAQSPEKGWRKLRGHQHIPDSSKASTSSTASTNFFNDKLSPKKSSQNANFDRNSVSGASMEVSR